MTIELQKKELKAKIQSGSLVARRALSQWNKLNTTIRGVVGTMKVNCKQKSVLIYVTPFSLVSIVCRECCS